MPRHTAKILGMMALATILGVVHAEVVNAKSKGTTGSKITNAVGDPFTVLAGGTLGTAILLFISDIGGKPGADFAVGLAGITLLASFIYAGPSSFNVITKATSPKTPKKTPIAPLAPQTLPAKQGAHP